jgi:WD40 repeat protein
MAKNPPPPPPPPPPPQSGSDRPDGARVFAFLVGVDDYQSEEITYLEACVEDVLSIESYLRWRYWAGVEEERSTEDGLIVQVYPMPGDFKGWDSLHICKLTNEDATYENVIRQFHAFASQAQKGDFVWFHFSGRGALLPTPREIEGDDQDRCMVCHDAHLDGTNQLTDKELAALFQGIARSNGAPHSVVTIDSSFASKGEGTGHKIRQNRNLPTQENISISRTLDDYFKDIEIENFQNHFQASGNKVFPPNPPWTLIDAAGKKQLAMESTKGDEKGGLFTTAMVEVLMETKGAVSYQDLLKGVSKVLRQKPVMEQNGIAPYDSFLRGGVGQELAGYPVTLRNGNWTIDCGTIHGLPQDPHSFKTIAQRQEEFEIEVFSYRDHTSVAKVGIEEVRPDFSKLSNTKDLSEQEAYYGAFNYFPAAPVVVLVSGNDTSSVNEFLTTISTAHPEIAEKNIQLIIEDEDDKASLDIDLQDGEYILENSYKYPSSGLQALTADLIKIANWKRLIDLEGPKDSKFKNVELAPTFKGKLEELVPERTSEESVEVFTLNLTAHETYQKKRDDRKFYLHPKVVGFESGSAVDKVYVYLLELWSSCEITSKEGKRSIRPTEAVSSISSYRGYGWGLEEEKDQDTLFLKLIVSEKELNYSAFLQQGIQPYDISERSTSFFEEYEEEACSDWHVKTIKIQLERGEDSLSENPHTPSDYLSGLSARHAFVIGINEYPGLESNLETARSDAEEVAKRLKLLQAFDNVFLMQDVGKEQIMAMLNWLSDPNRADQAFSIDDKVYNNATSNYSSQTGWLKTEQELKEENPQLDLNGLPSFQLVTTEHTNQGPEQKVTRVYLDKASTCEIQPEDAVAFYFAGHGVPPNIYEDAVGYLAPTDAQKGGSSEKGLIKMDLLYEKLSAVDCHHFLMILDCCYAGRLKFAQQRSSIASSYLTPIYHQSLDLFLGRKAWQVLVSAGPDETAADSADWASIRYHSPFADTFIKALAGAADFPTTHSFRQGKSEGDGIITASELSIYITDQVFNITDEVKLQLPDLFTMEGDENGEFVFFAPNFDINNLQGWDKDRNPYKGLESYQAADKDLFFGRKRVIKEVLDQLDQTGSGILFFTGASGTGKTSLVKAGIAPALISKTLIDFRMADLMEIDQTALNTKFEGDASTIVLLDQFDDYFLQTQEAQQDLEEKINYLLNLDSKKHLLLFTLRSDFEWQMGRDPFFLKSHWKKENIYRVPPLTPAELEEIITEPAWLAMYEFRDHEEDIGIKDTGETLIHELVSDFVNAPGALPLLSFTMYTFFEEAKKTYGEETASQAGAPNGLLLLKFYQENIQGIEGAISRKADQLYGSFSSEEEQAMFKSVLLRMVDLQERGTARRRVYVYWDQKNELLLEDTENPAMNELIYEGENQDPIASQVITKLLNNHLIVIGDDAGDGIGNTYIEPAHDALIQHWHQCQEWIEESEKETLLLQRKLWSAVKEYHQQPETKQQEYLWAENPRLDQAKFILDQNKYRFNKTEAEFIRKSLTLREDRIQRLTDERNRAMANEFAAKAVTSLNRKTAFRLAELAHAIDPKNNLTVKEKLLQYYYFDAEPPHYSLDGHRHNVSGLAFSDDGELLATSGTDHLIYVWHPATGRCLHRLEGHHDGVAEICFFPGSNAQLISASYDKTLKIWQENNGSWEVTDTLEGHDEKIEGVAISPNGQYIASGDGSGRLILWSVNSKEQLSAKISEPKKITSLGFSPNSQRIVVGFENGKVVVCNIKDDQLDTEIRFNKHFQPDENAGMPIYSTFFLDDEHGVSGARDRRFWCWKINGETIETHQLLANENERADFYVRHGAISPNQKYLALSEDKLFLYKFNETGKKRGELLFGLEVDAGLMGKLAFSKKGGFLAGIAGTSVKVWKLDYPTEAVPLEVPYDYYFEKGADFLTAGGERNLAYSPNNDFRLEAGWKSKQFKLIENNSSQETTYQNDFNIHFLNFLKDGTTFLSGDANGKIKFWRTTNQSSHKELVAGTMEDKYNTHKGVLHVTLSKDEQTLIAVLAEPGKIKLWRKEGGDFPDHPAQIVDTGFKTLGVVQINPVDEKSLMVAGDGDHTGIKVFDLQLSKESPIAPIARLTINEMPNYAHYSDDGQLILSYDFMGALRVWDANDGTLRMSFPSMINTSWGKLLEDAKKWLIIARRNNHSHAVWFDSDRIIETANNNPWMGALTPDEITNYQIEPYLKQAGYLDADDTPAPLIEKGNEDVIFQFGQYFAERCYQNEQVDIKMAYFRKAEALLEAGEGMAVLHKSETYLNLLTQLRNHVELYLFHTISIEKGLSTDRKYLSCTSDGQTVDLWSTHGSSGRQHWRLDLIPGHTDLYHIHIEKGLSTKRKYLSCSPDGSVIDLSQTDDGSGRQQWKLQLIPGHTDLYHIYIENGLSTNRKYLNCSPDGRVVDLWHTDDDSGRQQWKIQLLGRS